MGAFMHHVCSICADPIAAGEWYQHAAGDYHRACFESIAAASVNVERWNGAAADCSLCHDRVAPHSLVVIPAQLVVHLRCFFNPPTAGRKSVGASAAQSTLIDHSAALLRCSNVLSQWPPMCPAFYSEP